MNRIPTYHACILIVALFTVGVHSQKGVQGGNIPPDLQDPPEEDPPKEDAEKKFQKPIEDVKLDAETIRQQLRGLQGPKDANEMTREVLQNAWDTSMDKTNQTSVEKLLPVLNRIGGEERLHLLRLLELMDKNMDLNISKQELVSLYSGPMASPDQALQLMFRLQDYDGNGYISTFETLNQLLTVDGINFNIYEKWTEALEINKMMDGNADGIVSLHEFMIYMIWQLNLGIATSPKKLDTTQI